MSVYRAQRQGARARTATIWGLANGGGPPVVLPSRLNCVEVKYTGMHVADNIPLTAQQPGLYTQGLDSCVAVCFLYNLSQQTRHFARGGLIHVGGGFMDSAIQSGLMDRAMNGMEDRTLIWCAIGFRYDSSSDPDAIKRVFEHCKVRPSQTVAYWGNSPLGWMNFGMNWQGYFGEVSLFREAAPAQRAVRT